MGVQTSYAINQGVALAGLIYDLNPWSNVSRIVSETNGIEFGLAVSRKNPTDKAISVGGGDFRGISVRVISREATDSDGSIKYLNKDAALVLDSGYIWAVCVAGCVAGDNVKYIDADGTLTTGAPAVGETQLDDAQWDRSAGAGELSILKLSGLRTTAGA